MATYLALLRGINVGGKNKVEMARLRSTFESAGFESVRTYINSGNVIFRSASGSILNLTERIETVIERDFDLALKVLVVDESRIRTVIDALPEQWVNDSTMKSDVMFLWEDVDSEDIIDHLTVRHGVDSVIYVPGAVLWSVAREDVTRGGMSNLIGSSVYKQMTIRNVNTTRKLAAIVEEVSST